MAWLRVYICWLELLVGAGMSLCLFQNSTQSSLSHALVPRHNHGSNMKCVWLSPSSICTVCGQRLRQFLNCRCNFAQLSCDRSISSLCCRVNRAGRPYLSLCHRLPPTSLQTLGNPQCGGIWIISYCGYIDSRWLQCDTRWYTGRVACQVGTIERMWHHEGLPVHLVRDSRVARSER